VDSNSSMCRKCARIPKISLSIATRSKNRVPKSLKTSPRIRTLTVRWNSWVVFDPYFPPVQVGLTIPARVAIAS
jgi:hypothetical protein